MCLAFDFGKMGVVNKIVGYWTAERRIRSFVLALLYATVYDYVYCNFVNYFFSYSIDADYYALHGISYVYYILIASFPFVFFRGVKTVAAAFSLFTYLLAYIPIINAILVYPFTLGIKLSYSMAFFLCMCLFFITDRIYLLKHLFYGKRKLLPLRFLTIFTIISTIALLIINRSQMTFVNFLADQTDLYDARADNNLKGLYLLCWLRGCFLPLMMVMTLKKNNYVQYFLTLLAFILVFMMDKQKLTIVFPFVLTVLFWVVKRTGNLFTRYFHSYLILFISIISFSMVTYILKDGITFQTNPAVFAIPSLFIMRTMCIEGMEAQRYLDFFVAQGNPFTNYGHINIVNALTGIYPYSDSVGQVVDGNGSNSNATFWLMDGVAAGGFFGVFVISFIFIIFKSIMNSADARCSVPLYVCITLQGITSMMNVSLFTSINSSGLLMLFLILFFSDTKELKF